MSDDGIRAREHVEKQVELRLKKTYTEAQKDILKKLDGFVSKHKAKDKVMRKRRDDGEISDDDYKNWLSRQVFIGAQWEEKVREITKRLTEIRGDDLKMIHDREIGVFADNANYQAYKLEHDIGKSFRFDIYDERTVRKLIAEKPALLPKKIVDPKKHNHWNQGIIANCITQGIIQGESIPKIARRIANTTANHNLTASTLYARTAMTCAQNSGRMERLRESKEAGINVKKQWLSTHDSRTRDSHIHLDGQVRDVGKPFDSEFGKIDFPGDPHAEPADVYNCRCTLVYVYPDYDDLTQFEDYPEAEQMSFADWLEAQGETDMADDLRNIVQGTDITGSWERRPDDYQFEIQDVMAAQGFDGLPRVVSKEEFDKAVEESGFIAQRTYSAKDQETLEMYKDALYNGEWYVDCSTGGAQYGQGMYCAADYTGVLSDGIKAEMDHYRALGDQRNGVRLTNEERYEKAVGIAKERGIDVGDAEKEYLHALYTGNFAKIREAAKALDSDMIDKLEDISVPFRGNAPYRVETITLTPDAKVIEIENLRKMMDGYVTDQEEHDIKVEVFEKLIKDKPKDIATYYRGQMDMIKEGTKEYEEYDSIWDRILDLPSEDRKKINDDLAEIKKKYIYQYPSDIDYLRKQRKETAEKLSKFEDEGSAAAALGYDAINAVGHGQSGSYTVILNRTKCIFLGGEQ